MLRAVRTMLDGVTRPVLATARDAVTLATKRVGRLDQYVGTHRAASTSAKPASLRERANGCCSIQNRRRGRSGHSRRRCRNGERPRKNRARRVVRIMPDGRLKNSVWYAATRAASSSVRISQAANAAVTVPGVALPRIRAGALAVSVVRSAVVVPAILDLAVRRTAIIEAGISPIT